MYKELCKNVEIKKGNINAYTYFHFLNIHTYVFFFVWKEMEIEKIKRYLDNVDEINVYIAFVIIFKLYIYLYKIYATLDNIYITK